MTARREHGEDGNSRTLVLQTLRQAVDALTVKQVAAAVQLSIATTRFHLTRLEADGLIRSRHEVRDHCPGRPQALYTARRAEAVDSGAAYQELADVLAQQLMAVAGPRGALEAGRLWAQQLSSGRQLPSQEQTRAGDAASDPFDRILEFLDDSGFAPFLSDDRLRIELRSCPFMSLARDRSDAVCVMHLGLLQALMTMQPDDVRVRPVLDGSGPCIVELPATEPDRSSASRIPTPSHR